MDKTGENREVGHTTVECHPVEVGGHPCYSVAPQEAGGHVLPHR